MHTMKDATQAKRIAEALRKLTDLDQAIFLFTLMGVLHVDCPEAIESALEYCNSSLKEKIQEQLDKLD